MNTMSRGFSLYLDLIRFIAATVVMCSHVWPLLFPNFPLPWPGHAAVVVFFVLSGYVIAFSTDRPGQNLGQYTLHRFVRISSVTLPALLLSILIAPYVAGESIKFAGPTSIPPAEFWPAIWVNAIFLGESWLGSISPPFNPPFWSLSYEVWYYAIFAAWIFSRPRWRIFTTATVILLAGLKIAILLPVWLLGVGLYKANIRLRGYVAVQVFATTTLIGLAFYWSDCSVMIRSLMQEAAPNFAAQLHGSNQFIGDYLLGLIVAANFIAVASLGKHLSILYAVEKPIRYLASFTLSIYLFHMPLTVFIWNGLQFRSTPLVMVLLAFGIFILGSMTEKKNKQYRNHIEKWFRSMRGNIPGNDPLVIPDKELR